MQTPQRERLQPGGGGSNRYSSTRSRSEANLKTLVLYNPAPHLSTYKLLDIWTRTWFWTYDHLQHYRYYASVYAPLVSVLCLVIYIYLS